MDNVAKDTLIYVGDLLERTHVVSVGQLFWRCPGWHVVLCRGSITSDGHCVFAVPVQKVVSSLFSMCILAAANYRPRTESPRVERETSYTTIFCVLNALYTIKNSKE